MKAATASRSLYAAECRVRSKNGEHRWFLARGVPRFGQDGRIIE